MKISLTRNGATLGIITANVSGRVVTTHRRNWSFSFIGRPAHVAAVLPLLKYAVRKMDSAKCRDYIASLQTPFWNWQAISNK